MMPSKTAKSPENSERLSEPTAKHDMLSAAGFLMKWNAELTQFYSRRYQEYWLMPFKLLSCRSMDDFHDLQDNFRNELFQAYRTEADRLTAIASEVSETDEGFDNGYAAGLLKAQEDAAIIIDQAKKQAERILNHAHENAAEIETPSKEQPARKQA